MSKKNILIASVLKPVDDTRMFEKFALSLRQTNKYVINIIGFSAKKNKEPTNINLYPIFGFSRFNIKRLFAPILFLKKIIALKPDLIIITTYELLIPAILYKLFTGKPVIYDLMENHFRNILYQDRYPKIVAIIPAFLIRLLEILTSPFIDHYFLAEKGYTQEFKFIHKKFTILENKFPYLSYGTGKNNNDTNTFRFVFTGTIAKNFGIYRAIEVYKNLAKFFSNSELSITGFVPDISFRKELRSISGQYPDINLTTENTPLPHEIILDTIASANCSLITYQIDPSTENCFPTKIFENIALQTPMLIVDHPYWINYCQKWDSCIPLPQNPDYKGIAYLLQNYTFYKYGTPPEVYWHVESPNFLKVIDQLFDINI